MKNTDFLGKEFNQCMAPVSEAMEKYAKDGALAFHTPGHKQGLGAHQLLRRLITGEGLRQEVSLMEELDDLHDPSGCIMAAEELAANLWGARDTMFMINGTTGAIHAMLLGTLGPGDKVLCPRNAHRSIIGGLILAGAIPVFIEPEYSSDIHVPGPVSLKAAEQALDTNPEVKAMIMVYPTYYGMAGNLKAIATLLHSRGKLLLVDEAHGAHLRFAGGIDGMPLQALECGADVVAQSTHKLLGSMTQTSMLHIGSDRVSRERLRESAALLQSTSPNQLLLASLDIARLQMAQEGEARVKKAIDLAQWVRDEINAIPDLYSPGAEICYGATVALDLTKVTVSLKNVEISGPEAEKVLRHKYKIQCELSDQENLLFIISMADTENTCSRLIKAMQRFRLEDTIAVASDEAILAWRIEQDDELVLPPVTELVVAPRDAFFGERDQVDFTASAGRISAETVTFYPPGVPVLCPGEKITADLIGYISGRMSAGDRVVGPADSSLAKIMVLRNKRM